MKKSYWEWSIMLEKKQETRVVWVDLVRIIMTWGVISIHGKYSYKYDLFSIQWFQYSFIGSLMSCCVPVFLMLSGYLVLQQSCDIDRRLAKRIIKIIRYLIEQFILLVLFSIIMNIASFGLTYPFSVILTLNQWESYAFGRSYFWMLLGCYLVSPLLYKIVSEKRTEKYYLILGWLFGIIIPIFVDLDYVPHIPLVTKFADTLDKIEVLVAVGTSYYFVLGHWIYNIENRVSKKMVTSLFLAMVIVWQFVNGYSTAVSVKYGEFRDEMPDILVGILRYGRYYGTYVGPILILYSVSTFLFFRKIFENLNLPTKIKTVISYVGQKCVYIFMIHGAVISLLRPKIPHLFTDVPLLSICIDSTVYFIVSLIFVVIYIFCKSSIKSFVTRRI